MPAMPLPRPVPTVAAVTALVLALALGTRGARADPRVDLLVQSLHDSNIAVRSGAALSLGQLHLPEAVPALIAAFTGEGNPGVRATIIAALGEIGDPSAEGTLNNATHDRSGDVRTQATRALAMLHSHGTAP